MTRSDTPPQGVPQEVEPLDELSVPVLVPLPAMSRKRTPTDPPKVTLEEFVRSVVAERQHMQKDIDLLWKKLDEAGTRIADLQNTCARYDERIRNVESNLGEFESISAFREKVMSRLDNGFGKNDDNGKLGALRARVDLGEGRRWWVITFCMGLLVTAGGVIFWAGRSTATLETKVEQLEKIVERQYSNKEPQP